jgi:ATP-dependent DNA helicase RecQ
VREDIARFLRLGGGAKDFFSIHTGFDRPNLFFEVRKPADKKAALLECLSTRKELSGIVYCSTRKAVEEVYELLLKRRFKAGRYHAGLEDDERRANQDDFLYDRKTIMVATNAFGMGIDKSNVSFVIHYNMPMSMESYYQEAGRAGRDGAPADCILFYHGSDVRLNEFLIRRRDEEYPAEDGYGGEADAQREHSLELLKQMTFYAAGTDCLRQRLLSYFGEESPSFCGKCSNCLTQYEEADITLEARKILSCVYRLGERGRSFGKTMISDILRGSKNEKIRKARLDSLSTYGIMAGDSAHRIRIILDYLIREGCLVLASGEYPVVELGPGAAEILRNKKPVSMMLPKEPEIKQPRLPIETKAGKSAGSEGRSTWSTGSVAGSVDRGVEGVGRGVEGVDRNAESAGRTAAPPEDLDKVLFEKLRELRKDLADGEGLPAYIVFSDASLRDMCRKQPLSLVQFSGINGVGSVKLEKYGEAFTALIRDHVQFKHST